MTDSYIDRRALLKGATVATAVAPLAALPALASGDDRALVAAEIEITELYAWADQQEDEEVYNSSLPLHPVLARIYELNRFIDRTAPATLVGVAVKLRRLLDHEVGIDPSGDGDVPSLLLILDFVHGAVGQPTHPTRPVYPIDAEDDG